MQCGSMIKSITGHESVKAKQAHGDGRVVVIKPRFLLIITTNDPIIVEPRETWQTCLQVSNNAQYLSAPKIARLQEQGKDTSNMYVADNLIDHKLGLEEYRHACFVLLMRSLPMEPLPQFVGVPAEPSTLELCIQRDFIRGDESEFISTVDLMTWCDDHGVECTKPQLAKAVVAIGGKMGGNTKAAFADDHGRRPHGARGIIFRV